jgi:ABC-type lipoprotein release transport system permease subunit
MRLLLVTVVSLAVVSLAAVALAASWLPAWRAAEIDHMTVLRRDQYRGPSAGGPSRLVA